MSNDPCFVPPGREWHIRNCLPIIPRPQWERYVSTGRFSPGIQKGLDETRDCHVQHAVVVDDTVIQHEIFGVFPPGWYRYCVSSDEPLPDVETTLEAIAGVTINRETDRAPLSPEMPVAGPLCQPVPTIDVLVPWPSRPWPKLTVNGHLVDVEPGGFGRVCLRIPGSDHPLFGTGLGIIYHAPQFLSELGKAYVASHYGGFVGMPGSWLTALWDSADIGQPLPRQWWTRDYAYSHMQPGCLNLRRRDGSVPRTRWRIGGSRPATPVGEEWDIFEVESATIPGVWQSAWIALRPYVQHLLPSVPEMPLGTGQFNGDPPGTYFPDGMIDSYTSGTLAPPSIGGGLGRTAHDPPSHGPRSLYGLGATDHAPPSHGPRSLYGLGATDHAPPSHGPRSMYGLGRTSHDPHSHGWKSMYGASGVDGIFDSIVDVVWDKPRALVGDALEKARDLTAEVWQHLPSEVRQLTMTLGPMVANMYAPGSGAAASAALQMLEGGRKADLAKKKLKRAQAEGQLPPPSILDLDNPTHVLALSRITDPEVQAQLGAVTGAAGAASAADPAAQAGVGTALLFIASVL